MKRTVRRYLMMFLLYSPAACMCVCVCLCKDGTESETVSWIHITTHRQVGRSQIFLAPID